MGKLTKDMVDIMLTMQDEMNTVVHPEWKDKDWNWLRACWIEAAEMSDHIGYKWWKNSPPDYPQAKMELIDIWHFLLSWWLASTKDTVVSRDELIIMFTYRATERRKVKVEQGDDENVVRVQLLNAIDEFVHHCTSGNGDLVSFFDIMELLDMSPMELYSTYVGKNTLNRFRQENGYKEGTYIKIWDGEEDNVYLQHLLDNCQLEDLSLMSDWLMTGLEFKYAEVVSKQVA